LNFVKLTENAHEAYDHSIGLLRSRSQARSHLHTLIIISRAPRSIMVVTHTTTAAARTTEAGWLVARTTAPTPPATLGRSLSPTVGTTTGTTATVGTTTTAAARTTVEAWLVARTTVRAGPKAKRRVSAGVLLPLHLAAAMNEGPCSRMAFRGPPATARSRPCGRDLACSEFRRGRSKKNSKRCLSVKTRKLKTQKRLGAGKG
jgi:hypothetical protein